MRDLSSIAVRVASARFARYLDEKVTVQNPDHLKDWVTTSDGKDLFFLFDQLKKAVKSKDPSRIPHILKNVSAKADDVLLYVKS